MGFFIDKKNAAKAAFYIDQIDILWRICPGDIEDRSNRPCTDG